MSELNVVMPRCERERLEICLKAIAFATNLREACWLLKETHDIDMTPELLEALRWQHPDRCRELRREFAPQRENELEMELLDNAQLGVQLTKQRLMEAAEREAKDPVKEARDASQVVTQAVDKRALMEGKPTKIIEKRSADELERELIRRGVLEPAIDSDAEEIE